MKSILNIFRLINADFSIELRQKHTFASILLYVVSTVFIISKVFQTVSPMLWNALFWILFLFTAVNASLRIFSKETSDRELYYYYLISPTELILAKTIYSFLSLLLSGLLLSAALVLFINNPVINFGMFAISILLGSLGMAVIFTLVSSITSKGGNNAVLMSVLSIPMILPVLLINLKLSAVSIGIIQDTSISGDIVMLCSIIVILTGVSVILFPQIWKT